MIRRLAADLSSDLSVRYTRFCLASSSFVIPDASQRVLSEVWDSPSPSLYVYWHDEFLLNLLLSLHWSSQRVRPNMPACVANDALGGEMIRAALAPLDVPLVVLARRESREAKLATLVDGMRRHRQMLLAADYGAPWFHARPTAFQIAEATGATLVAMHLRARRDASISTGGRHRVRLPTPKNAYEVILAPIAPTVRTVEGLTAALHDVRRAHRAP